MAKAELFHVVVERVKREYIRVEVMAKRGPVPQTEAKRIRKKALALAKKKRTGWHGAESPQYRMTLYTQA